jgi:hypothetical protein
MSTLTLEIPEEVERALRDASRQRQLSEAALALEVLREVLVPATSPTSAAGVWLAAWRGRLGEPVAGGEHDPRLAFLLDKHLR